MAGTVMLVDNGTLISLLREDLVTELGLSHVGPYTTYDEAIDYLSQNLPDVIVIDDRFGDGVCSPLFKNHDGECVPLSMNMSTEKVYAVIFDGDVLDRLETPLCAVALVQKLQGDGIMT